MAGGGGAAAGEAGAADRQGYRRATGRNRGCRTLAAGLRALLPEARPRWSRAAAPPGYAGRSVVGVGRGEGRRRVGAARRRERRGARSRVAGKTDGDGRWCDWRCPVMARREGNPSS